MILDNFRLLFGASDDGDECGWRVEDDTRAQGRIPGVIQIQQ